MGPCSSVVRPLASTSTLVDINIAMPAYYTQGMRFIFFSYIFTFNLLVCLYLKYFSCKQQSCFVTYLALEPIFFR